MKVVSSKCEVQFINNILSKGKRIDGRGLQDGRPVEICFGKSFGSCIVMLENTRVLAQVSCELTAPRSSRPTEGILHINLELSPMAAPNFESGRLTSAGVEVTRLLERGVRDSKCLDLESLCVVAGSKVWCIRVDVQALNNDGNLIECSSIAAIAALAHFKRPYVAVQGTEIKLYSLDDHTPVPLTMHHMPINVNLALFRNGNTIVVDPLDIEERVSEGSAIIGVNAHQEICSYHLSGVLMLNKDTILRCTNIAVKHVQLITQKIRSALDNDNYKRATNQPIGFVSLLQGGKILGAKHPIRQISVLKEDFDDDQDVMEQEDTNVKDRETSQSDLNSSKLKGDVRKFLQGAQTALFEGGSSKWCLDDGDDSSSGGDNAENDEESDEDEGQPSIKKEEDSSSEEEKFFLKLGSSHTRGWYTKAAEQ